MQFKDYYEILEVHRKASTEVINKAYVTLAKMYHPDLNRDKLEFANEKMKLINEAYETLKDTKKRELYNQKYDQFVSSSFGQNFANDNLKKEDNDTKHYSESNKNGYHNNRFIMYKDWIYFKNYTDDKLYKMNIGGTRKVKIDDENKVIILKVKDGWIYYLSRFNEVQSNCHLSKIRIEGTNKVKLSENCNSFEIYDQYIYLKSSDKAIYRTDLDGRQRIKIKEKVDYLDGIIDDTIYYSQYSQLSDNSFICPTKAITLDGREKVQFSNHLFRMNIIGDWIYFCDRGIYKINKNGNNKTLICSSKASQINIYDGWIYYVNEDDTEKLYKVKLDGTQNIRLNNGPTLFFDIVDGWMYYYTCSKQGLFAKLRGNRTYKMKIDGSLNQEI